MVEEIPFSAEKMFCVTRNPMEIIASYAFFTCMKSHSLMPTELIHEQFPDWWDKWVKDMAEMIRFNHDYITNTLSAQIPTYIFRYEDLVLDPEPVLLECFRFLLDVHSLEGTVVEQRIKNISQQGFAAKSVYALKNTETNLNKNRHMYNEEQMKHLKEVLLDYNLFMGYTNSYKAENDPTSFFNYAEGEID